MSTPMSTPRPLLRRWSHGTALGSGAWRVLRSWLALWAGGMSKLTTCVAPPNGGGNPGRAVGPFRGGRAGW